MPGTPMRRPISGTPAVLLEEKLHKKQIRRSRSYRQFRRHKSDAGESDFAVIKNLQSLKILSNSARVLTSSNYSLPLQNEKFAANINNTEKKKETFQRPLSLDLDGAKRVVNARWSDDFKVALLQPRNGKLPVMTENHGEDSHSEKGLVEKENSATGFKKSLKRKDTRNKKIIIPPNRHSLESLKSPSIGNYLKESWDTFFVKISEKHSSDHQRQAVEACEWLKAAGFPQYVQLYEDGSFPVDIASASTDHDFLGQDDIAALVRRLNILNKCAHLKLDKTASKEVHIDNEDDEEELEQYALSEFWKFEKSGHRWSRMDSKSDSTNASNRASYTQQKSLEGFAEDSGEVFANDALPRSVSMESSGCERRLSQEQQNLSEQRSIKLVNLKPKSQSFLKRVGGDLKKFGSFKRKDAQRPVILPISFEDDNARSFPRSRHKSLRKNRKIEIGEPVLQGGHEKLGQLKCTPIESTPAGIKELQNQHRSRKPSSHSLMSSSSSSGGGSTVSTPASRRTRASTEDFSSDLGDFSPGHFNRHRNLLDLSVTGTSFAKLKEHPSDKESSMFVIPLGHKPGTFPSDLQEKNEESSPSVQSSVHSGRSRSISEAVQFAPTPENQRKSSRPMSVYDNLPDTISGDVSTQDLLSILDPGTPLGVDDSSMHLGSVDSLDLSGSGGIDPAFWSVDDIVEHAQTLQQMVGSWDDGEEDSDEKVQDIKSVETILKETVALPPTFHSLPSYTTDAILNNDADSENFTGNPNVLRNQILLRWEPIKNENSIPVLTSDNLQLHSLSTSQLMMLRRLSLLKLTARMEQYTLTNNKGTTLNWSVPRFIKRIKVPDYKDKTVFGVPLLQNVQRIGHPLPVCIQHAIAHLRLRGLDQIGLFRKPGVRGRIHRLRALCEVNPELNIFPDSTDYDIADMIKQYFRELPDPLMTMKMSDTFVGIFLHVPVDLQLQTVQAAIMLLPDENQEVLKTLLHFLSDIASNYDENHMNATNLATCFAPSLFYQQIGNIRLNAATLKNKKSHNSKSTILPDHRAMNENRASNECLAFMITHVNELFKISEDAITQCRMSVMQQTEDVLASEIGFKSDYQDEKDYYTDFHSYVDRTIRDTLREEQRFIQSRGWQSVPSAPGCELAYKKMNDGIPLRMWRSKVDVSDADPMQVMDRILNERHLWDEDLIQWKVLQQLDEKTQLFQMVRLEMSPHPSRDYCVLRSWRHDITSRGVAAIVEVSTGQSSLIGDVRGVVLTSRYIIEPTDVPNKCVLKHMSRVDTKGRNPEWYNKAYGHIVSKRLLKIRDSIKTYPPKLTSSTS